MNIQAIYAWCLLAGSLPFLFIVFLVIHGCFFGLPGRPGKLLRLRSPGFVLGLAFQFIQVLYQPSHAQVLEARLDEAAEEDDEGDPESTAKQLHRQLRRIRRGERLEHLTLRL